MSKNYVSVGKETQVTEKEQGGGLPELGWEKRSPELWANRCSGALETRGKALRWKPPGPFISTAYVPYVMFPEGKEDFRKRSIRNNEKKNGDVSQGKPSALQKVGRPESHHPHRSHGFAVLPL